MSEPGSPDGSPAIADVPVDAAQLATSPTVTPPTLPVPGPGPHAVAPDAPTPGSRTYPYGDYRELLGSRRWDAAPLRNPEVEKTDPRIAVAAIVILATVTLVILVAGYASGFWTLPDGGAASGAVAALELLA